ncbi:uncharacterized protein LOC110982924 [Acanthaster planci]|uniref:Uncharacterized protein LOC110982924 n=1 Tax=Acanthaster planci TaxID=133434 RepID=A0A8B7YY49_ACAPL|nr:uncharacterized protein LOC110982924 [Acanthaster planci]
MGQPEKASVAQAEREIKDLRAENVKLKKELEETRSLYKQLVDEGPVECFDERRVHLLKSQVIQLERQVLLYSNALSSRTEVLLHVENCLQTIADQLRELVASEVKGPSVPVQRSQLTGLIETAEGARLRLFKNVEANNPDRLARPILYMGSFLKPAAEEDGVTLLDICSGKLEHLSLKQIAKLESKLFSLHRHLQALHQSLKVTWSRDHRLGLKTANHHLSLAVNQRMSGLLAQCEKSVAESCSDLLSVSILVPSAPWPLVIKPVSAELSLDSVMSALPSFPKSKQQQGRACVDALLKACNYSRNVAKLEAKACVSELHFHQKVYDVQSKYMESLFTAVREAYTEFEQNTHTLLCQPLKRILEAYSTLTSTTSEEALKDFLTTFKAEASELETVVEMLTVDRESPSSGQEALSTFGRDFFKSVDALVQQCADERDRLAEEIEAVKQMKEDHQKQGLKVFERPKPAPKSAKDEYEDVIKDTYETEPRADKGTAPDPGRTEANSTLDSGGKLATKSSAKVSKSTLESTTGSKIGKEQVDGKSRKGPRVLGKVGGTKDLDGILREAGRPRPPSALRGTLSPARRGTEGDSAPRSSQGASRIPRSGSTPRLKPPSPKQSPLSNRAQEGSKEVDTTPKSGLPHSPAGLGGVRRSASEGSRLSFKATGAKPGSQGST